MVTVWTRGGTGVAHDWVVSQVAYLLKIKLAGKENVRIYADIPGYDKCILENKGRPDLVVVRGGRGYVFEVKHGNSRGARNGIAELQGYLKNLRENSPDITWTSGGIGGLLAGRGVCPSGDVVYFGNHRYLSERMDLGFAASGSKAANGLILYKRFRGDNENDGMGRVRQGLATIANLIRVGKVIGRIAALLYNLT